MGKIGGSRKSEAKTRAARANAKRPRKKRKIVKDSRITNVINDMKPTLASLRKIAALHNCTIEDDKHDTRIWVNANEGWSFDNGERSCNVHSYGCDGVWEPKFRNDAIAEAMTRLASEPPTNIPYKYND